MGRSSKWLSLVRKAKAFVSLKGLKGFKKKLGDTNGILLVHEKKKELNSNGKILEEKNEAQQEAVTEECVIVPPSNSPPPNSPENLEENVADSTPTPEKSQEELAAVKIQAAFRGVAARKKVKAMKALQRLQSMLHGKAASKQTSHAMRCIQSFAKMQSQVRLERARFRNHPGERKEDQEKQEEEQVGDWDDSILSKDQIRAKIQSKNAAAAKRERTLAYAFSHQLWRSYPKDASPPSSSSDDDDKPAWSWSWLEQWMTSRSWESLEEPKAGSNSPARLPAVIQSPGRSKQQVPASYKKIVADIQPKFAPGSPNTRFGVQAQRKFSSMSSPSRIQAQAKSAKVHNDSSEEKSIASIKPGSLKHEFAAPEGISSPVDTRKMNRALLGKTNGSIGSSPGRSPRVGKRIP
ncbi:protein IQ-DOMAIN 1 [Selaginella moellendorffii]|uniref:protein IQ-DOMAIN 1 n=1 Tax=Selaginella moellendorffii TaxID=88036 RepID=UPI000D1C6781|nr:protein IQ-DOMAIN 1 [Selaginella moellendorffii]|eukprot:XP_024516072.1 protein IQ-DOMAIN 1 [Selaginella moellendorffii]